MKDKAVYKHGMHGDRSSMGKKAMHRKMGDYFPKQYDPNNPDNKYAGDVADGTAQKMEGAAYQKAKKYKIEQSSKAAPVEEVEPGVAVSVGTFGSGIKTTQVDVDPNKPMTSLKPSAANEKIKKRAAGLVSKGEVESGTSNKSRNTTFYTQADDGLYTVKKKEFNLERKTETGEDRTIRSFTKYNKKGEVKKHMEAESGTRKFDKIANKQARHLKRGRKKDLLPSQAKKDNAAIAEKEALARIKQRQSQTYVKGGGKNPRFL